MLSSHSRFISCYGKNMRRFKSCVQADESVVDRVSETENLECKTQQ